MTWNNYFELRWSSGSKTRRFKMLMEGNNHASRFNLSGFQHNLDGELMITRVTFRPRHVKGLVRVGMSAVAPDGSWADLEEAAGATDLEAKMFNDAAFWRAAWLSDFDPNHLEPSGTHWVIPIELQQIDSTVPAGPPMGAGGVLVILFT